MPSRTVVGLVQISREEVTEAAPQYHVRNGRVVRNLWASGPLAGTSVYLPYSVGLLQAYAQRNAAEPGSFEFLLPIYRPTPLADAIEKLQHAGVAAFSTYIWNIRQSLRIAKELKRIRPQTLIVFGGPQVPNAAEDFLREHPFIDIVCHGEGERVFLQILEQAGARDWSSIPSVSYLDAQGAFIANAKAPRVQDLSQFPSPFLEGIFEPLMRENPDMLWQSAWETNRGCPFGCTFCDWGSAIAGKVYRFDMDRVKAETDWFARKRITHVFFCDANFGILTRDIDIAKAYVESLERHNHRMSVSIQTAKNSTDRCYEVQRILWDSGRAFFSATTSLQSVDPGTLKIIKRDNISLQSFHELQRRHRENGVPTNTEIIVGLPGETYESFANGLAEVISRGQHNFLNIYECQVLPNAEMGLREYQKRYGMQLASVPMIEGGLDPDDEAVVECIDTVVATASMPAADWERARAFAWATQFLYFDRLLQIPFIFLAGEYAISYREMIEAFLDADAASFPVCAELAGIFVRTAEGLQNGKPSVIASPRCLNQWWSPDSYALISLASQEKWTGFFEEAEQILQRFADDKLLSQCIRLNRELFKRPGVFKDASVSASANLLGYYEAVLAGKSVALDRSPVRYDIDRTSIVWPRDDDWYRFIDEAQGDPARYLYRAVAVPVEILAAMT
ncbi:MAG TPA: radical SAM protein [Bryobacteraceae bacterium]|nr:radical SAM protein [Bryobacteraceae bacterium]